jgi:GT2 family glycosyltransferase
VDVSIIVVLEGGAEQALRCFSALAALPEHPAHEVVVVDDASVGLEGLLARLEGDVKLVRQPHRSGFAAAARAGLARAEGRVAVLLRGAPEVAPNFLAPLLAALDDPGVAGATAVRGLQDAAPPVAAHVLAARRRDLEAIALPDAPDGYALAAIVAALARRGRVEPAPTSVALPAGTRTGGARRAPGEEPEVTIVIPTLDAVSERVRRCVAAVQRTTDAPHDIVLVDNGAPPQGFTAPVNAGLRAARGPYAVVMNDDVEPLDGWWPPLRAALDDGVSVVFPLTVDGAMRSDFAAWCFALSRATLDAFAVAPGEFFDPALRVWFQDTDLLQRLRAAGNPPLLVPDARIRHGLSETVLSEDPELRAWIAERVVEDKAHFEVRHGTDVLGAARLRVAA